MAAGLRLMVLTRPAIDGNLELSPTEQIKGKR